jgi:hypothetical protein
VNIDERIANLVAATASGTAIEQELMRESILAVAPTLTKNPGSSRPLLVVLETRRNAFFKRFRDQDPNLCQHYRHHPIEVPLNEVAAWRLAWAMGNPWRQLAPTAVFRKIDNHGGALINQKRGEPDPAVFADAKSQVWAAALWDALIGNQDRNARNFKYDAEHTRLGLIDHGFVFARRGDPINVTSYFHAHRSREQGGATLSRHEQGALEALLDSDLYGLRDYLAPDRADALEARARQMQRSRCLPMVGAF